MDLEEDSAADSDEDSDETRTKTRSDVDSDEDSNEDLDEETQKWTRTRTRLHAQLAARASRRSDARGWAGAGAAVWEAGLSGGGRAGDDIEGLSLLRKIPTLLRELELGVGGGAIRRGEGRRRDASGNRPENRPQTYAIKQTRNIHRKTDQKTDHKHAP